MITGVNAEELEMAIKAWFEDHPDFSKDKVVLQLPVDIVIDGKTINLSSDKELEEFKLKCETDKAKDKDSDKATDKDKGD